MEKLGDTIKILIISILFLILSQSAFLYKEIAIYIYIAMLLFEFIILWNKSFNNINKSFKIISIILLIAFYIIESSLNVLNIIIEANIILLIVLKKIYKNKTISSKNIILFLLISIILSILLVNIINSFARGQEYNKVLLFLSTILNIIIQIYFYKKSIEKNIDKTNLNSMYKIILILLVVIFTIYNIISFSKILKNYNKVNSFIETIEIENESEYTALLNEYKNNYNIQKNKDLELKYKEELETNEEFYLNKANNSIFTYDRATGTCEYGIILTKRLLISNTILFTNKKLKPEDIDNSISFLNASSENIKYINNIEKFISILLVINMVITDITIIYCVKKVNHKEEKFNNF